MANPKLFVLLVGINEYPEGVSNLSGCVSDTAQWQQFLESEYKAFEPEIVRLSDTQATRLQFIDTFRRHLGQAKDGDLVLFQYSGHGSRETAPTGFHRYFPDGKNETLVLSDSRTGGYDFADKELGLLLHEISQNKPDLKLSVVLDCCHSGSGTRDVSNLQKARLTRDRDEHDVRPPEAYLEGLFKQNEVKTFYSRHGLLAACSKHELAWETQSNSGLFTSSLMKVFEKYGANISNAELFRQARAYVRQVTSKQAPQLETYGGFNANYHFLTHQPIHQGSRQPQRIHFIEQKWTLEFGAIQGLPNSQSAELALYASKEDFSQGKLVGQARTREILADKSYLELDFEADPTQSYVGEFLNNPIPPTEVFVYAEQAQLDKLAEFQAANPSLYLTFVPQVLDAQHQVKYRDLSPDKEYWTEIWLENAQGEGLNPKAGTYQLIMCQLPEYESEGLFIVDARQRLIQGDISEVSSDSLAAMQKILESLARWENLLSLQNTQPQLNPEEVVMTFTDKNEANEAGNFRFAQEGEIEVFYKEVNGEWQGIDFELKVENKTPQTLQNALLILFDNYEIMAVANEEIPSGKSAILLKGEDVGGLHLYSENGTIDLEDGSQQTIVAQDDTTGKYRFMEQLVGFKLLTSTERLDDFVLNQAPIDLGWINWHKGNRGFGKKMGITPKKKVQNDWFSKTILVKIVRQNSQVGQQTVQISQNQLQIKPHSSLKADVVMSATQQASRGVLDPPNSLLPDVLQQQPGELLNFKEGNLLQFNNLNQSNLEQEPLLITLNPELYHEEELLLPLGLVGNGIMPLGEIEIDEAGNPYLAIAQIPEADTEGSRSLGRALKMAFFKLVLRRHPDKFFRLAWVEFKNNGEIERHTEGVAEKVAQAQKVLLVVHGIIGDTEEMAKSLEFALHEKGYDLVLTFDYENLNSSISEDISYELEQRLKAAGFSEDDGKELNIIAHSMGGLVSRWMIEQRGVKFVDRLVMAGTPNGGSVFGDIQAYQKFASTALGIGLTAASPLVAWVGGLMAGLKVGQRVLKQSGKIMTTLGQMRRDSTFIRDLANSPDPGIPYQILAGDVNQFEPEGGKFARFLEKIQKQVGNYAYKGEANDIAVSLEDIKKVPNNAKLQNFDIACHHMNYFSEAASLKVLKEIL